MLQARVENGSLVCPRFGEITGIDCSCLREKACHGCFIFDATLSKNEKTLFSLGEAASIIAADASPKEPSLTIQ